MTERKYPDGEPIPASLPSLYRVSNRCGGCLSYIPSISYCNTWNEEVRPDYVCALWTTIALVKK